VKAALGIEATVAERKQAPTSSATDVFNALLRTANRLSMLLEDEIAAANPFVIATVLVHVSMQLHLTQTKRMMPNEVAFEPNKTPEDVFPELMACFDLVKQIATSMKIPVATLERTSARPATESDLADLGIIAIAELDRVYRALGLERAERTPHAMTRKFPSHVLVRVRLLKQILTDVAEAKKANTSP
jgi:hypothetical protein